MTTQVDIRISQAEATWLNELHSHAASLFAGSFLPSHDQHHHQRVWHLCRLLLRETASSDPQADQDFVDGLLIAAYFHDLGMVRSTAPEHGYLGRELCEEFFRERPARIPARMTEVLEAIELHDVKDVHIHGTCQARGIPGILTLLSVADNLEALGCIGIYRYAEIYLLRRIPLENLGGAVIENAGMRFSQIARCCTSYPEILRSYQPQYEELVEFFHGYQRQLEGLPGPDKVLTGHLGVINLIRIMGLEREVRPETISQMIHVEEVGEKVAEFFNKLSHELEKMRL